MFGLFSPSSKNSAADNRTAAGDFSNVLQGGSQMVTFGGGLVHTLIIVAAIAAVVIVALPLILNRK